MYDSPPFWEHGTFLQPQHFQLERLQAQRSLAALLPLINPYLWGLRRFALNETALGSGAFEIVSLELLLPTGEWALVPENATLPLRSFHEVWTNPETPLTVHVGLAVLRDQGGNVLRSDEPGQAAETFRFTAPLSPEAVTETGSGSLTAGIYSGISNGAHFAVRHSQSVVTVSFSKSHARMNLSASHPSQSARSSARVLTAVLYCFCAI